MFLAVSDDMDWVERHLAGVRGMVLAGSLFDHQHDEQHDLDPAVMDLALLSSCNHSIVTQV